MDILFELHKGLPRCGPGNDLSTLRALSAMRPLVPFPKILDVGCGPGMQTIALARASGGTITAVDLHEPFLAQLRERAAIEGLASRIQTLQGDLFRLPFSPGSFDVIWAEGSIYLLGFEKGLRMWRSLLKPGGYLAATEISWLREQPPEEVLDFWKSAYPGMNRVHKNRKILKASGFTELDHFTLPVSAWWDDYYLPLQKNLAVMLDTHAGNPEAMNVLLMTRREMQLFEKYSDHYGYVFYVMQMTQPADAPGSHETGRLFQESSRSQKRGSP